MVFWELSRSPAAVRKNVPHPTGKPVLLEQTPASFICRRGSPPFIFSPPLSLSPSPLPPAALCQTSQRFRIYASLWRNPFGGRAVSGACLYRGDPPPRLALFPLRSSIAYRPPPAPALRTSLRCFPHPLFSQNRLFFPRPATGWDVSLFPRPPGFFSRGFDVTPPLNHISPGAVALLIFIFENSSLIFEN